MSNIIWGQIKVFSDLETLDDMSDEVRFKLIHFSLLHFFVWINLQQAPNICKEISEHGGTQLNLNMIYFLGFLQRTVTFHKAVTLYMYSMVDQSSDELKLSQVQKKTFLIFFFLQHVEKSICISSIL